MKHMSVGTKVLVFLPEEDRKVHKAAAEYHGKQMKISHRVSRANGTKVYYELAGAELNGLKLGFVREWLIPLDERSE